MKKIKLQQFNTDNFVEIDPSDIWSIDQMDKFSASWIFYKSPTGAYKYMICAGDPEDIRLTIKNAEYTQKLNKILHD